MPLVPLVAVLLLVLALVLVLAVPLSLVQRYRLGSARRLGRGWVATLNFTMLALSSGIFLCAAAITNLWVPDAFVLSLAGFLGGGMIGLLGLALTRWEEAPRALHYTPNRWLIFLVTFAVATRLLYGLWRGWQAWGVTGPDMSWLAESGAAGSLAVGAIVLGYYLAYSAGVRRRVRLHRKRQER